MKNLILGCSTLVFGLLIGGLLAVLAMSFMNPSPAQTQEAALTARSDVSVTASLAYANTMVQSAVKQTGLAKQATVALAAPNLIRVTTPVTVPVLGKSMQVNATVALRVSVQNAKMVLQVESVEASGITIPTDLAASYIETMRVQAQDQVNRLVTRALAGTGLSLSNIRIAEDAITVDLERH